MTYDKMTWENRVRPRINATNLNRIETGIDEAHNDISTLNAALVTDLILGETPTLSGWTVDPTDAADITDGDSSTACTTGSLTIGGGYQYAYIEYDLGDEYNVVCTALGGATASAGTSILYVSLYCNSVWRAAEGYFNTGTTPRVGRAFSALASKVRIGVGASVAATITPDITEFHAWRL